MSQRLLLIPNRHQLVGLAAVGAPGSVHLHLNSNLNPFKPSDLFFRNEVHLCANFTSRLVFLNAHTQFKNRVVFGTQEEIVSDQFPTFCQQFILFTSQLHKNKQKKEGWLPSSGSPVLCHTTHPTTYHFFDRP